MSTDGSIKKLAEKLANLEDRPTNFSIDSGSPVKVSTNVFPIFRKKQASTEIFQYHVTISPEPKGTAQLSSIVCSALFPGKEPSQSNVDWNSLIYLQISGAGIIYSARNDLARSEKIKQNDSEYEIEIVLDNDNKFDENFPLVASEVINKCFLSFGFSQLDNNFINNTDYKDVDHLRIVSGFSPHVDFFADDLCLFLETATRIDRKITLYDFLKPGITNTERRQPLMDSLQKLSFVTRHLPHQKTVKVLSVKWDSKASIETFDSKTTVADYFSGQYNFVAKPDDPIVEVQFLVHNDEITSLPASALSQIGITESEKNDNRLMSSIRDNLFPQPNNRKQKLESSITSIKNDDNLTPIFNDFQIDLENPLILNGFILDPPQLIARDTKSPHYYIKLTPNNKMVFDVSNINVAIPPKLNSAPLIIASDQVSSQVRDLFIPRFMKTCIKLDIFFNYPEVLFFNYGNVLMKNEIFEYIKRNGTPSFIIFFLTDKTQQWYNNIKQLLVSTLGIPSQIINSDSFFKRRNGVDDILNSIAFQITAKTGGVPYYVQMPIHRTLIIGIAGYKNNSEYVSYCLSASLDQTCARFYSDTIKHKEGEFLTQENLSDFVKRARRRYSELSLRDPERVIIYRLVSDDNELLSVATNEIPSYRLLFENDKKNISLVVFAVQKQSTIRLFVQNDDKIENPPPGTIVFSQPSDNGLATFYLVSNYTQFGTAMPVKYTILTHSPPQTWTDNQLATLTYHQCFNYNNYPGAVRLPSPLMNAIKVATFSHQHLKFKPPSNILLENVINFV